MDIVVWLRSLGLGNYEAIFRENDIDEAVLLTLTAEDLKELGVTSFGQHRKLVDAIATLRNDDSGKTPSVDASTTSSTPSSHAEDGAERRQVTVMFSDSDWYDITAWRLSTDGRCTNCDTRCHGVFEAIAGQWGRRRLPVRLRI